MTDGTGKARPADRAVTVTERDGIRLLPGMAGEGVKDRDHRGETLLKLREGRGMKRSGSDRSASAQTQGSVS